MIMLEKVLRATDQNPTLDDHEIVYVQQQTVHTQDVQPIGWLSYWWASIKNLLVQDVPEELAFCEFECRESTCLQGSCKNPQKPT